MSRSQGRSNRATPTISTVAAGAGVSVATVSRVMNGVPTVDPALVERVRQVADETGYRPNPVARGLARGTMRTLGVVVPNLGNPFFHRILKGIEANARSNDFRLLIADSDEDIDEEVAICEWLATQVDSVILCSPRMDNAQLLHVAELAGRVVMTNRHEPEVPIPAVCIDSHDAMYALAGLLRDQGHQRLVYMAGPERSWAARDRLRSLTSRDDVEVLSVPSGGTVEDGYRTVEAALELRPDAIVGFNDLVAFGALSRMKELDVDVPGDVSLTGFDDIPFSTYLTPSLTSVRFPHKEMGDWAWRLVDMDDASEEPSVVQLKAELVPRMSTAPVGGRTRGAYHAVG